METKSDKLTIQEAARYIGCEIISFLRDGSVWSKNKLDAKWLSFYYGGTNDKNHMYYPFKLILRSIEDMTEEESKVFAKINIVDNDYYKIVDKVNDMSKCINYLRSIGVDCDNLISQGKAIRKESK
jgi:hypothetical protein